MENTKSGRKGEIQLTDALSKYNDYLGIVSKNTRYDIGDIETWITSNLKLLIKDERYNRLVLSLIEK